MIPLFTISTDYKYLRSILRGICVPFMKGRRVMKLLEARGVARSRASSLFRRTQCKQGSRDCGITPSYTHCRCLTTNAASLMQAFHRLYPSLKWSCHSHDVSLRHHCYGAHQRIQRRDSPSMTCTRLYVTFNVRRKSGRFFRIALRKRR